MTVITSYQDAATKSDDVNGTTFAYRELGPATGWGESGLRLASGAYPEASIVLFTALDPEAEKQVRIALTGFEAGAGQRIRAYAWDVEEVA